MPTEAAPIIYHPRSLGELLQLRRRRPGVSILAGGTYLMGATLGGSGRLDRDLISLESVEEMHRLARSDRYLEIGAAATLDSVLQAFGSELPPHLRRVLSDIGPLGVRSAATLGGNLCVPDRLTTAVPALAISDARIELRRSGAARWLRVENLRNNGSGLDLRPGEVLTRIRIPRQTWTGYRYQQFGSPYSPVPPYLLFIGVYRSYRRILDTIRIIFASRQNALIRSVQWERDVAGTRLPLSEEQIQSALEDGSPLAQTDAIRGSLPFETERQRELRVFRARALLRDFLASLR